MASPPWQASPPPPPPSTTPPLPIQFALLLAAEMLLGETPFHDASEPEPWHWAADVRSFLAEKLKHIGTPVVDSARVTWPQENLWQSLQSERGLPSLGVEPRPCPTKKVSLDLSQRR